MEGVNVLAEFLGNVTTFITSALSWVGQVFTTITDQPGLLTMCICIPVAGVAIGYVKRLLSL